jgi:hypothetical protein
VEDIAHQPLMQVFHEWIDHRDRLIAVNGDSLGRDNLSDAKEREQIAPVVVFARS